MTPQKKLLFNSVGSYHEMEQERELMVNKERQEGGGVLWKVL